MQSKFHSDYLSLVKKAFFAADVNLGPKFQEDVQEKFEKDPVGTLERYQQVQRILSSDGGDMSIGHATRKGIRDTLLGALIGAGAGGLAGYATERPIDKTLLQGGLAGGALGLLHGIYRTPKRAIYESPANGASILLTSKDSERYVPPSADVKLWLDIFRGPKKLKRSLAAGSYWH